MPSIVGSGGWVWGNNASVVPPLPSGLQAGDILVLVAGIREDGATIDVLSGWNSAAASVGTTWTLETSLRVQWRWWQSGDTSPTVTFTGGGSNDTTGAMIFAVRGVSTSHAVPVINANSGGVASPTEQFSRSFYNTIILEGQMLACFNASPNDSTSFNNSASYIPFNGSPEDPTKVVVTSYTGASTLGADMSLSLLAVELNGPLGGVSEWPRLDINLLHAGSAAGVHHQAIVIKGALSWSYSGSGGEKSGGAGLCEYIEAPTSGSVFSFTASGGTTLGGAATTSFIAYSPGYEYTASGGSLSGGAAETELYRLPIEEGAYPVVHVSINGIEYHATQATIRRDSETDSLLVQLVGKVTATIGQTCSLSVDYVQGCDVIAQVAAFSAVVTESTRSSNGTSVTAITAATIDGGIYEPSSIQVQGSNTVRGSVDFRVRPGNNYNGATIRSVTTTLGVNSPWFTEVHF